MTSTKDNSTTPGQNAPPVPKAPNAKAAVPAMTEGTRQEVEIYGRGVDPFTGGLFRRNKETGEVQYFAPGEPDPDQPKPRA